MVRLSRQQNPQDKQASRRISASRLLPVLGIAAAVGLYCGVEPRQPGPASTSTDSTDTRKSATRSARGKMTPLVLRAARNESVQKAAGAEYALARTAAGDGAGLEARNPQHELSATLDARGVHVRSTRRPGATTTLSLSSYGCAAAARSATPVAPRATSLRNRTEYVRDGVTEWYINGPLGLEQGFTVERDLDCGKEGALVFAMTIGGDVDARLAGEGAAARIDFKDRKSGHVVHYGELFAFDATGKALPSRFALADARSARYPITVDPTWYEQTKLLAGDKADSDDFGYAVALSADGSTAIVGANSEDDGATTENGAAYIFTRAGSVWTQQAKLVASDAASNDQLGFAVAISSDGNTVIAGALGTAAGGAAYVFTRSGTTWTQEMKLTAGDAAMSDNFGYSVALSADGNTALVGALGEDDGGTTENGAAYAFTRSGTTWTQEMKLLASDKASNDGFGVAVALSADGNTALIGAHSEDDGGTTDNGKAYAFTRAGTTWSEQALLLPMDKQSNARFGISVGLSSDGNTGLIGAYAQDETGTTDNGAAYVFTRSGTTWSQQAKLLAGDAANSDSFGFTTALSGDGNIALVGAPNEDDGGTTDNGAAYTFTRLGTSWAQDQKFTVSDKANSDELSLGLALSRDGRTLLLGARGHDDSGTTGNGAAYPFSQSAPNGEACIDNGECASGNCIDDVCCDTSCGLGSDYDCMACSTAKGAVTDGTCGTTNSRANWECRPARSSCDIPEICDGSSTACPTPDVFERAGFICNPESGACDEPDYCDGTSANCLPRYMPSTTICRAALGPCDLVEKCDGTSRNCPGDNMKAGGALCRVSAGPCDEADACDGSTPGCPDTKKSAGIICKPPGANLTCDPQDYCDGIRSTCPARYAKSGTACGVGKKCNGFGSCL
jgi:hypothetical protein